MALTWTESIMRRKMAHMLLFHGKLCKRNQINSQVGEIQMLQAQCHMHLLNIQEEKINLPLPFHKDGNGRIPAFLVRKNPQS